MPRLATHARSTYYLVRGQWAFGFPLGHEVIVVGRQSDAANRMSLFLASPAFTRRHSCRLSSADRSYRARRLPFCLSGPWQVIQRLVMIGSTRIRIKTIWSSRWLYRPRLRYSQSLAQLVRHEFGQVVFALRQLPSTVACPTHQTNAPRKHTA